MPTIFSSPQILTHSFSQDIDFTKTETQIQQGYETKLKELYQKTVWGDAPKSKLSLGYVAYLIRGLFEALVARISSFPSKLAQAKESALQAHLKKKGEEHESIKRALFQFMTDEPISLISRSKKQSG